MHSSQNLDVENTSMRETEWVYYLNKIERVSQNHPNLENLIHLVVSMSYLFPYLKEKELTQKQKFLDQLCQKSDYWELEWIKQLYNFELSKKTRDYLIQKDWWWHLLSQIGEESIDSYSLSKTYESLKSQKQQKKTGVFFTPKNQIKVICRYALLFFLHHHDELLIDDEILYQIIFHCEYPSDLHIEEYHRLSDVLTHIKILDPSCGTGLFLTEMVQLLVSIVFSNPIHKNTLVNDRLNIIQMVFTNLFGYDISSESIRIAKVVLSKQFFFLTQNTSFKKIELEKFMKNDLHILKKDFLIDNNSFHNKFDLIIGNPPYIRHHGLYATSLQDSRSKTRFFQGLQTALPELQIKSDKKADFYIYFWLKAIIQLNKGGTCAFVLSRAWLSSRYAITLKQVLLSIFHLDLILELPLEVWKNAEVRTHIVVGCRNSVGLKSKKLNYVVWKDSVESILQAEKFQFNMSNFNESMIEFNEKEIIAIETSKFRHTQISDLTPFIMNSKKIFPLIRLDYLAMSSYLMNLLISKKDRFCLLKELGKLEMGSTTGANRFFYLDKETALKHKLPKENLYLMTKSPKEWKTIFSPLRGRLKLFLHIPKKLSDNTSRELRDYIEKTQDNILKRPYFKNKTIDNWYRVPLIQPDLLLPNMIFKRSFVAYNRNKLHIDKQWIGFWANIQRWIFPLLGFLNSTLGILLREVQGTKTLGLGSLKLSLQECRNLLVLDPRKIPEDIVREIDSLVFELSKKKICEINTKKESLQEYSKIQEQLDYLILVKYLELTSADVIKLHKSLQFEIRWRFAKELRINYN